MNKTDVKGKITQDIFTGEWSYFTNTNIPEEWADVIIEKLKNLIKELSNGF